MDDELKYAPFPIQDKQNKDKPKFERSCLYFGYQYNLYSNVPCLLYYNPILLRLGYAEITEPTGMNFVFK